MKDPMPDPQTLVEEGRLAPRYLNPAMEAMAETEFQQWRHHPVTRSFLLFLAQRAQALSKTALDLYMAGNLEAAEKHDPLRGRIAELEGLCEMKLSDIRRFYGVDQTTAQPSE